MKSNNHVAGLGGAKNLLLNAVSPMLRRLKKSQMKCRPLLGPRLVLEIILPVLLFFSPLMGTAQLVITNGVQTYATLTSTTVTMSNRCELRVTGTNNPIAGSVINLNSPDAWFLLPNLRPAAVSASYLSQVFVNGAAASAGVNCRVDQYAMGTVIVPQPPGYVPLTVFSGQNFLGASAAFGTYTYYTGASLGAVRWNMSSFRLKRGYSVTFAQFANGSGASKVYVAQDGDLEIGALPANLDHQCDFIRVIPWRWVAKKGWGGAADATAMLVDPLWSYDWNNAAGSTLDMEYVPMKWGGFTTWDSYSNLNNKQGSTQLLGYNEPDQPPPQANVTVADAIALWPYLMQSGLRLGAPGVSDSGVAGLGPDWLYSFMNQATNLGYRVDYVPVHSYKCGWSATQLYNYLLGIYQVTGRPIWLTEFNNGASWCTPDTVTQAQEATAIGQYIDMLESAPFVERYAIYQWFPTNRAMVVNGALTPAGVVYHNKQSTMAYAQTVPAGGSRSIAQFQFETNTLDSSGYANNAFAVGAPTYTAGHSGSAVAFEGTNIFLQLPPNIANSANFSFAGWVNWSGGAQWQRIFDFGNDQTHYLFLTPSSGGNTLRFAIRNGGAEQIIETTVLASGSWQHVAVTLSGSSAKLYTNGVLAASSSVITNAPSNFNPQKNYLGKSQFADPLFRGSLDEVQIADYAFTAAQVSSLMTNTPPQFTSNLLSGGTATQGIAFSGSIAGAATDADPGDTLTYSKAGGLACLNVAADGSLSGTPGVTDGGTNNFTVRVTDAAGASAFAMLTIITPFTTGNGIWYVDSLGNWSDTTKWTRACPANGAGLTADFSALDIAANRTVTLDSSRSLGALKFRDLAGAQAWTVAPSGGSVLTLDTASAAAPSIVVGSTPTLATSNAATISASVAGTNGFTKSGWGNLILAGGNPLSGTLNIDTSSTTASDGAVQIGAANAGTNLTAINIRNNNAGSSTLQFAGGASVSAPVSWSGRSVNVAGLQNISGSNLLSGPLSINVGGSYYVLQSDAGTLNLGGIVSSAATGTRNFTFQGAGDFYLSGSIQNGSAATVNLIKQDAGNLIFANTNTFTGGVGVGGGSVKLNLPSALQTMTLNLACAGSNALKFGPVTGATIAGLNGLNDVWLTNASLAAVTLTNGNNNASSEYSGVLRGSGGLMKIGSGTVTLDNTNAYTGATSIAGGTVRFGTATNVIASLQPVLWMSFDSVGSGIVTNQGKGGWGLNGTLVGTGAYITNAGRFGSALYINGVGTTTANNIVLINNKVADTSASGSWSLGYWIKTATAGAVILYQGDGGWSSSGQTTYLLNANSGATAGTKAGAVRWAGGFLTGTTALNDGNWHFITLVDTAGAETIYVDGNADTVTSSMTLALAAGANQTWIGGAPDTDAGAVKMTGMIDEVCLFDRALTQVQIRSIVTNTPVTGKLPAASAVNVASGGTLNLSGYSQSIASLADLNGGGGSVINSGAVPVTLTFGGNIGTGTFSGIISDTSSANAISLVKNGAAAEVLAGANNYRGSTTVNAGTFAVNGTLGSGAVTVNGGALGGNGVIAGPVTIQPAGTLSPGNATDPLTINNTLTLNGTILIELDRSIPTNDVIQGVSTLNYGGTLTVTNLAGTLAANDSFKLFNAANFVGAFAATNLPPLAAGLGWQFTPGSGSLSVVQTVNPNPTNLVANVVGGALELSWPADHIGWRVQTQANALAAGLGSNWVDMVGASATNFLSVPMDAGNETVFYRMIFP